MDLLPYIATAVIALPFVAHVVLTLLGKRRPDGDDNEKRDDPDDEDLRANHLPRLRPRSIAT